MIVEHGRVIEVDDESARIAIEPENRGKSCHGCGLCRQGKGRMVLTAPRSELSVGDEVEIDVEGLGVWWAIVLVQIVPLAALVLGGILGWVFAPESHRDLLAAAGAVGGFVLSLVLVRFGMPKRYRGGVPRVSGVRKV